MLRTGGLKLLSSLGRISSLSLLLERPVRLQRVPGLGNLQNSGLEFRAGLLSECSIVMNTSFTEIQEPVNGTVAGIQVLELQPLTRLPDQLSSEEDFY